MPGMKVTVDAAMRARDVSRPRAEQEAAAQAALGETSAVARRPGMPPAGGARPGPRSVAAQAARAGAARPGATPRERPPGAQRQDPATQARGPRPAPGARRDDDTGGQKQHGAVTGRAASPPGRRKRVRRRRSRG